MDQNKGADKSALKRRDIRFIGGPCTLYVCVGFFYLPRLSDASVGLTEFHNFEAEYKSPPGMIAKTPLPPYYAVIFSSLRTSIDDGYGTMNDKLIELIQKHPGYLGHESAREEIGITAAYFDSLESIKNWKTEADHKLAQQYGREKWYTAYKVRICKVERDYGFELQT